MITMFLRGRRWRVALILCELLMFTAWSGCMNAAGQTAEGSPAALPALSPSNHPAVLICTPDPGHLDSTYLSRLASRGFNVGVITSWSDFTWERLHQYNAIVLCGLPRIEGGVRPSNGVAGGPNLAETLALLERYLGQGGGVLINIEEQSLLDPGLNDAYQKGLAEFGAKLPMEKIEGGEAGIETRLQNINMYYASGVHASPVSDGVRGAWLPVPKAEAGHMRPLSGPIDVDGHWTVALSGGAGVKALPFDLDKAPPETRKLSQWYSRKDGVADPALFAIREYGGGRLALGNVKSTFHVAAGTKWLYDGVTLDKGLNGRPSDYGRLLENTFRWLSQPSLANGKLGGAKSDPTQFVGLLARPGAQATFDRGLAEPSLDLAVAGPPAPVQRGFIGARSEYSGGEGTVEAYAAAARRAGLQFVVFLDPMEKLSRENLAKLKADCARLSGDDLLLLPGYWMATNAGPRFLSAGSDPVFPDPENLGGPGGKTLMVQPFDKNGRLESSNHWLGNIFRMIGGPRQLETIVGYFDFTRGKAGGGFQMWHSRACGATGVMFYEHGKLVEDLTADYLATNAATMTFAPLSVDLVSSPAEMEAEVKRGDALVYAAVPKPADVLTGALRWNHQFEVVPVSVSTGPVIRRWPVVKRAWVFGAEDFVNEYDLLAADLEVTSDRPLREVSIYDGPNLVWRIDPVGAKSVRQRVFRSAALQQDLSVVAIDVDGRRAVSFPARTWKDGSGAVCFCGDHVNDCRSGERPMRMGHGPNWGPFAATPNVADAGVTWDGGPGAFALPIVWSGAPIPNPITETGGAAGNRSMTLNQHPLLEFSDERVYRGKMVADGMVTAPYASPWSWYAPIEENPLFDAEHIFTEIGQYSTGVDPNGWGAPYLGGGNFVSMVEQTVRFKRDVTLKDFYYLTGRLAAMGSKVKIFRGRGTDMKLVADLAATPEPDGDVKLETGDWIAIVPESGSFNPMLMFVGGDAMRFGFGGESFIFGPYVGPKGTPVKKGDANHTDVVTYTWPLDEALADEGALCKELAYIANPDGMKVARGTRIDGLPGLLNYQADAGALELSLPKMPDAVPPVNLPVRLAGLNKNWSAGLFQIAGENGREYYGPGRQVFRPLGLDPEGRAYFPLYPSRAPVTHVIAGHPVVATGAGSEQLFIQVVALDGPRNGTAGKWHVEVNNPTDRPIKAILKRNWAMPGLLFERAEITLPPGGVQILEHNGTLQPIPPSQREALLRGD